MVICFGSVLYDEEEELFKMWYGLHPGKMSCMTCTTPTCMHAWLQPESVHVAGEGEADRVLSDDGDSPLVEDADSVLAYAVSADGIDWQAPELGLHEYRGTSANGIVKTRDGLACSVVKDMREADPSARYKMLYCDGNMGISAATSPDGVVWNDCEQNPVILHPPGHDSQNVLYFDSRLDRFVAITRDREGKIADVKPSLLETDEAREQYRQLWRQLPDAKSHRRVGMCEATSTDLTGWTRQRTILQHDQQDTVQGGEICECAVDLLHFCALRRPG